MDAISEHLCRAIASIAKVQPTPDILDDIDEFVYYTRATRPYITLEQTASLWILNCVRRAIHGLSVEDVVKDWLTGFALRNPDAAPVSDEELEYIKATLVQP